jgi:hypothetical protein
VVTKKWPVKLGGVSRRQGARPARPQRRRPKKEKNSGKAVGGRAVSLFLPDCDSL